MKKLKYILTGLFVSGLLFTGCSDDLDVKSGINELADDEISISFNMPEPEYVQTRVVDPSANFTTGIFFFEENNGNPSVYLNSQQVDQSISSTGTVKVKLEKNVISAFSQGKSVAILVLANISTDEFNSLQVQSYSDIEQSLNSRELKNNVTYDEMSGIAESDGNKKYTVNLKRLAAKITMGKSVDFSSVVNFTIDNFSIYNAPSNGYYMAPWQTEDTYKYNSGSQTYSSFAASSIQQLYTYPVKSMGISTSGEGAYFIMKASYDGEECYYRIDLRGENKASGEPTYYDIEPNHWYDVQIKTVLKKGYATAKEAAEHPMALEGDTDARLVTVIHDHTNEVLSMTSDGSRELGVNSKVNANSTTAYFQIKCFDANDSELDFTPAVNNSQVLITVDPKDEGWLSIGEITLVDKPDITGPEVSGDAENSGVEDNRGKHWNVEINISSHTESTGKIYVRWGNLERVVTVHYKPEATAFAEMFDYLTLIIHDRDELKEYKFENKYLNLLAGEPVAPKTSATAGDFDYYPYGLIGNSMSSDKQRTTGLHFPVMYGKDRNNPWWYEYELHILWDKAYQDDNVNSNKFNSVKFSVAVTADKPEDKTYWEEKLRIQRNNGTFVPVVSFPENELKITESTVAWGKFSANINLKLCDENDNGYPNDYDQHLGNLIVTINRTTDKKSYKDSYLIPLYHTGFFDVVEENKYATKGNEKYQLVYYEVVKLGDKYWLDRNLGATTNGMDIINADGASIFRNGNDYPWPYASGNSENAIGQYYFPAKYYELGDTGGTPYDSPEKHLYGDLCPPGWRLPRKKEFDDLRLSPNFITEHYVSETTGMNYYSSYYDVDGTQSNRVYFPKGRYKQGIIDDNVFMGDADAGYYWTGTQAAGTEKEEIGKWLRALCLSGGTTNYVYGDITKHLMSVRCIADDGTTSDPEHTISFNVSGVTNVYLYTYSNVGDSQLKTGLMNWPGKGVMDAVSAKANKKVNFSFNSTVDPEREEVYVIFTYVENGVTKTICNGDNEGLGDPNTLLKDAKGWKVKVGKNYYFTTTDGSGFNKASDWDSSIQEDK